MGSISGVDEDVLVQILSYLPRRDLYHLSLVSRHFERMAHVLLWRRIEFRYRYISFEEMVRNCSAKHDCRTHTLTQCAHSEGIRAVRNSELEFHRFVKLYRTVYESPQLGALVHEYVHLFKYTFSNADPLETEFLLFLPNLRTLTIQATSISDPDTGDGVFMDPSVFGNLSELSLDLSGITFADAARFMLLPKLKSLSIRGGIHGRRNVPESYKAKSSTVRFLDIDWSDRSPEFRQGPSSQLSRLLGLSRELEKLSIKMRPQDPCLNSWTAWDKLYIYPSNMVASLAPVRNTLKELEIISIGGTTFVHDRTMLDLRTFDRLQKISISSIFAARRAESSEGGWGLHLLFPKSIEELKVRFHGRSYLDWEFTPRTYPITEDFIQDFKWLIEASKAKKYGFSKLRRIAVSKVFQDMGKKPPKNRSYLCYDHEFLVPEGIEETLRSTGIAFSFDEMIEERIRSPRENIYKP